MVGTDRRVLSNNTQQGKFPRRLLFGCPQLPATYMTTPAVATVYIKPEAVAKASNHLRELEADERREVVKILIAFTDLARPHMADIKRSYNFMGEIDFIRAKASFAAQGNLTPPTPPSGR